MAGRLGFTDRQYYAAFNADPWILDRSWEEGDIASYKENYYVLILEGGLPANGDDPVTAGASIWQPITGAVNALGDNRFISLEDIINNYMVLYTGADMHGSNNRLKIEAFAQRAIQEFSYDTFSVKSLEYEIGDLPRIPMPQDYVSLVALNTVDSNGLERWMVERKDSSNPISIAQNNNGVPLFDNETGEAMYIDSYTNEQFNNPNFRGDRNVTYAGDSQYERYGQRYYLNTERVSNAYTYVINEADGTIEVDNRLMEDGQVITLKYVSDGLSSDLSEIKVHKFAEQAIYDSIYYENIARMLNVPANEKDRAKRRMKGKMKQTKLRLSNISPRDLLQTLRAQAQWIKT